MRSELAHVLELKTDKELSPAQRTRLVQDLVTAEECFPDITINSDD